MKMTDKLKEGFTRIVDPENPYSECYAAEGKIFYLEPVFLLKLSSLKNMQPERYEEVIAEMKRLIEKNRKVVFIGDDEEEITKTDSAVFLTIQDVCNPLKIYVEDKSRGSEYGD